MRNAFFIFTVSLSSLTVKLRSVPDDKLTCNQGPSNGENRVYRNLPSFAWGISFAKCHLAEDLMANKQAPQNGAKWTFCGSRPLVDYAAAVQWVLCASATETAGPLIHTHCIFEAWISTVWWSQAVLTTFTTVVYIVAPNCTCKKLKS